MDNINIGIIIAQIINFGILFFAFRYFLGDKLTKALLERREQLSKLEKVDSEVKNKLDEAKMEHETIVKDARKKAGDIEKNAEMLAKKNKENILLEAETQASNIVDSAQKNIEKERLSMINSIKSRVIDLSLLLNSKLFDKEKVNKDFIEKELNSINS